MASYTPPVTAAGPQPISPPMVGGPSRVPGIFPPAPPQRPIQMPPAPAAPPPNGGPADQIAPDLTRLNQLEGFGQAYPNIANAVGPPPAPAIAQPPGLGQPPRPTFSPMTRGPLPESRANLGVRAANNRLR